MTHFIAHRINNLKDLYMVPDKYGVEIDLRDRDDGKIILEHDPFTPGLDFGDFLAAYKQKGTLILNVKSERIEHRALELLDIAGVTNFFFLDSTFPMMHLLSSKGERRVAVRYSEYEGLDTVLNIASRIDWVWVDTFSKFPIDYKTYSILKETKLKICLVSPELQGHKDSIPLYRAQMKSLGIEMDAICTKLYNIPLWES